MEPKTYRFYKGNRLRDGAEGWFIDHPDWEGDPDDLEMVAGADTMLDYISNGSDEAYLKISDKHFYGHEFYLEFSYVLHEGGVYNYIKEEEESLEMWLCYVTQFVFGYLPQTIYCQTKNG